MNLPCLRAAVRIFIRQNICLWSCIFIRKTVRRAVRRKRLDFNARLEQFEALGYTVVGISRDGVKAHQNFCAKQGFRFELLSDKDETVCRLFDVIKLKKLYGKESLGIERSTFVLNKDGEIAHEWRKVKVAGHAQEVLETLSR